MDVRALRWLLGLIIPLLIAGVVAITGQPLVALLVIAAVSVLLLFALAYAIAGSTRKLYWRRKYRNTGTVVLATHHRFDLGDAPVEDKTEN